MTDRFVDERPARLARQHDGVRPRGRGLRTDIQHRATRRSLGGLAHGVLDEHLEAERAAHRLESGLEHGAVPRDDVHREVDAHAGIGAVDAVAVRDQDLLHALGVGHRRLRHTRVMLSGDLVGEPQQCDFALHRHGSGVDRDRMWSRKLIGREPRGFVEAGSVGHAAGGAPGDGHDVVNVGHVAVGVDRLLAAHDADAGSLVDAGDRVLDPLIIEDELQRLAPFPEQLGPIATARQCGADRALYIAYGHDRRARDGECDDRPLP